VQYVKADLGAFLSEAEASISDQQIQAYYDANKEEFRNIDLPSFDSPPLPGAEGETTAEPANPLEDTGDAPQTTDPAEEEPTLPDQQPLQDDPNQDGPKENSAPEPDAAGDAADTTDDAEPAEVPAPPDKPAAADATELSEEETETAEQAAAETPEETEPETSEEAETETPEQTATETAGPTESAASDEDPLADLPDAAGGNVANARPEFKPLEEVADIIRTRLATPIARQKMDQALAAVRSEMKAYFGNYLAWDVSLDRDTTPQPTPPDLRPLVQQHGLTLGNIPLVTIFQLQQTDPVTGEPLYEISRAYDTNYVPFAQYMFSDDLRRFEVREIRGQVLDTEFLYWKTDDVAERVPELNEVRDEVARALKMRQALDLAKQDAQQVADKLNETNQRPSDIFAGDPNRKVIEASSVTWMSSTAVPYLPPRLSRVPGIEHPGDDFMRSVFSLAPGQAGTAVDNPQKIVYVVAVTSVDSDEEQLRTQFLQAGTSAETVQLAQRDGQRQLQQWYAKLEKDLGIRWHRDPLPDSRAR
jgi:hypothetical protein